MRDVDEWIGKNDNQAIPILVRERVALRANRICKHCDRQTDDKLRPAIDHIISIGNGGPHRESNMQLLCVPCHAIKTKADMAQMTRNRRVSAKHMGIHSPRRQRILSPGFARAEPQRTASRPITRKSER